MTPMTRTRVFYLLNVYDKLIQIITTGLEINNSCGQGIDIGSIPESNKRWMGNTKEWITIMTSVYST